MVQGLTAASRNTSGPAPMASSSVSVNVNDKLGAVAAASSAVAGNPETSNLGSLEFNTPYAHQIAALAAVLIVVATASVVLAVKFTSGKRRPTTVTAATAATSDDDDDACVSLKHASNDCCDGDGAIDTEDDDYDDDNDNGHRGGGGRRRGSSSWECAPIMLNRLRGGTGGGGGAGGGRYESLQQTDGGSAVSGFGGGRGGCVFRFNARRDTANGLLCLYGMRVVLLHCVDGQSSMEGWRIVIDIVTQTDIERRQTRLQTGLVTMPRSLDEDGVAAASWESEPLNDVLTVKLGQSQGAPLKGDLLINVLGQKPSSGCGMQQQPQKLSMVKLGCGTFPMDRIAEPGAAPFSVVLRDEVQ